MDREQRLDEVITAYLKAVEAGQKPDNRDKQPPGESQSGGNSAKEKTERPSGEQKGTEGGQPQAQAPSPTQTTTR